MVIFNKACESHLNLLVFHGSIEFFQVIRHGRYTMTTRILIWQYKAQTLGLSLYLHMPHAHA